MEYFPKISIVIPVYKVENYLNKCVESVLNQTYKNIEIILVDDGSPDNCPIMCDALSKKDIRVKVIHKINGGLSSARNVGIYNATGEYLMFLDSDDYWNDVDALNKLVEIINSVDIEIIQFGYSKLYDDKLVINKKIQNNNVLGVVSNGNDYLNKNIENGSLDIAAWSKIIKRSFIIDNNLYFVEGLKSEDVEWTIRVLSYKPIFYIANISFYVYRQKRKGSITANIDYNHLKQLIETIQNSFDLLNSKDEEFYALKSYLIYQLIICCACCKKFIKNKTQRKETEKILKVLCKKYLLKYKLDRRVKKAYIIYKFFGYKIMSYVLSLYLVYRGRKQ